MSMFQCAFMRCALCANNMTFSPKLTKANLKLKAGRGSGGLQVIVHTDGPFILRPDPPRQHLDPVKEVVAQALISLPGSITTPR